MAGDFAYDIFFRYTTVRVWGNHNFYPVGSLSASNVISAGGRTFDLWEGYNSGAGRQDLNKTNSDEI